ncbi:DUF418 domain-containing protein [Corynebacterium choanae]|uniref:DUF418 domain-containing protein n=1 Tax=Corynebacterium choanae TaxID=1862358 RepID=A0A3G6JC53_9CORY|nr:DUF418 domain-containing protein [Corynebacterium choanae]AZA13734.1 hypothetical protein CCHOA_06710 [Corynebacterium choanae]
MDQSLPIAATTSVTDQTPVTQRRRLLSPDVARGLTLLSILIANITTFWLVDPTLGRFAELGGIGEAATADRIAMSLGVLLTHVRGLPMFATLLGYGLGMIAVSLWRKQFPLRRARLLLIRRYGILALFGVVHLTTLFWGDIMLFYGVAGIITACLMSARDKILLWIAGVCYALSLLFTAVGVFGVWASREYGDVDHQLSIALEGGAEHPQFAASYAEYFRENLAFLAVGLTALPVEALMVMPVILVGFVAGRRSLLRNAAQHTTLLWWTVVIGGVVGLATAIPQIWIIWTDGDQTLMDILSVVNAQTGFATGPAIVAGIALACIPLQRIADARAAAGKPPVMWWLLPLVALGKRSMTGYVLQSVLCLLLFTPFSFAAIPVVGGAYHATLYGLLIWAVTVIIATGLELAGLPGPLEWLHRRLAYGRRGLPDRYQLTAQEQALVGQLVPVAAPAQATHFSYPGGQVHRLSAAPPHQVYG